MTGTRSTGDTGGTGPAEGGSGGDGSPAATTTTSPAVVVRLAAALDVPACAAVEAAAGRAATSSFRDGLRAAVLDPRRCVVVAEHDGVLVGWAKTHLFPSADGVAPAGHYLSGITVHPAHRRAGVGAALTQARWDWLAGQVDVVHYVTNARNAASLALHRRWGFTEVARGPRFHGIGFDGGEGVLLRARLTVGSGAR